MVVIIEGFPAGMFLFSLGLSLVNLLGLIVPVKNSTLRKTIYFNVICLLTAVIIIGSLFKIMHWPGGAILLITGFAGISVTYTIRFIKKPIKRLLDVLKWGWVATSALTSYGIIMHWFPKETTYIPNIIMITAIGCFVSICLKYRELLER